MELGHQEPVVSLLAFVRGLYFLFIIFDFLSFHFKISAKKLSRGCCPYRATILNLGCHRVGRMLSFFSSRRNWDCPNPSPAGECASPPLAPVTRGAAPSLAREGSGESQFQRGDIHSAWYSLYICNLCWVSFHRRSRSDPFSYVYTNLY